MQVSLPFAGDLSLVFPMVRYEAAAISIPSGISVFRRIMHCIVLDQTSACTMNDRNKKAYRDRQREQFNELDTPHSRTRHHVEA